MSITVRARPESTRLMEEKSGTVYAARCASPPHRTSAAAATAVRTIDEILMISAKAGRVSARPEGAGERRIGRARAREGIQRQEDRMAGTTGTDWAPGDLRRATPCAAIVT